MWVAPLPPDAGPGGTLKGARGPGQQRRNYQPARQNGRPLVRNSAICIKRPPPPLPLARSPVRDVPLRSRETWPLSPRPAENARIVCRPVLSRLEQFSRRAHTSAEPDPPPPSDAITRLRLPKLFSDSQKTGSSAPE